MNKICTTIATEDLDKLKYQIDKAFAWGSDYVEIRFDFLKLSDMSHALKIVEEFKTNAIFTIRSPEQEGKFKGSHSDRITWLKKISAIEPMLLDIELKTIKENDDLADYLEDQKTPLLVSWHNFEETPENTELTEMITEMRIYSNNIKVVTTAKTGQDALRILDLYENANGLNLVAFAMGDSGILSRILCTIYGNAPFTYASLEKAVVPGQLTVKQIRKIYDKINVWSEIYAKPS